MLKFLKKSPAKAIEAELADLQARDAAMLAKLAAAETALSDTRQARDEALIADSDAEVLSLALQGAERSRDALASATAALEQRIAETKQRLLVANDTALCEAIAADREKAASEIEKISAILDTKIKEFATVFGQLSAAIPVGAGLPRYGNGGARGRMTPNEHARAIATEAFFSVVPQLFEIRGGDAVGINLGIAAPVMRRRSDLSLSQDIPKHERIEFLSAVEAAGKNVAGPLRQSAKALREGAIGPGEDPDPLVLRKPIIELSSTIEGRPVVFLKPCSYTGHDGLTVFVGKAAHAQGVPLPVAEAALELGLAILPSSPEAKSLTDRAYYAWRTPQPGSREEPPPPVDLQVNIQQLRAAEFERLNQSV